MDRKEFLILIWKRGIKPIFLIVGIYYCIKYSHLIYSENGFERASLKFLLGAELVFAISYLISILFKVLLSKIWKIIISKINFTFSITTKFRLVKIGNFIERIFLFVGDIVLIIFGILLYLFRPNGWIIASILVIVLAINNIIEKRSKKKQLIARHSA